MNFKSNSKENGIVNTAKKLLATQIKRLKGIFPKAMPVKTIPEAMAVGATAIIQTPTIKSSMPLISNFERKKATIGNNANIEISAAKMPLMFLTSSTILLASSVIPERKKAIKIPMLMILHCFSFAPTPGKLKAIAMTNTRPMKNQCFIKRLYNLQSSEVPPLIDQTLLLN